MDPKQGCPRNEIFHPSLTSHSPTQHAILRASQDRRHGQSWGHLGEPKERHLSFWTLQLREKADIDAIITQKDGK